MLYGIPPPLHLPYFPRDSTVTIVDVEVRNKEEAIEVLKCNILKAQQRMKLKADKKPIDRSFSIGDLVFIKLQPYRQNSFVVREIPKLSIKYYGPYNFLDKIGKVAYKLDLST